jgi:ABC-type transporter Mla subunit MlaD
MSARHHYAWAARLAAITALCLVLFAFVMEVF